MTIKHGTEGGYRNHRKHGVAFPEDSGKPECGCRAAHAASNAGRYQERHAYYGTCSRCGGRTVAAKCPAGVCSRCRGPVPVRAQEGLGRGAWVLGRDRVRHWQAAS